MDKQQIELHFSVQRFKRYLNASNNFDEKAALMFNANLKLSQALYIPLSILEVTLRNKINTELQNKYQREDWFDEWYKNKTLFNLWNEINKSVSHLHKERKPINTDRIIASLMFGFWTSLFNQEYEKELWTNLRFIFPNMPKEKRQRKNISAPLNDIRKTLRNRIYHNEPVIFNINALGAHYQNILLLLNYMGTDILDYNNQLEQFTIELNTYKQQIKLI